MNYEDKKIVGIIASNVEPSVALNVIGHLSVAIGKYSDEEIMGQPIILLVADYPKDMLETRTDDELVESINGKENDKLEYLGAVIYGNTKDVNEITGKFQLWRID